jgi:hypothetical protein
MRSRDETTKRHALRVKALQQQLKAMVEDGAVQIAFNMISVRRLGQNSPFFGLPDGVIEMIIGERMPVSLNVGKKMRPCWLAPSHKCCVACSHVHVCTAACASICSVEVAFRF